MRIGIVHSELETIAFIKKILAVDSNISVVFEATHADDALRLSAMHKTDCLIVDLNIPFVGGVELTRQVMRKTPCSILVVSNNMSRHSAAIFEAMGYGAIDAIDVPDLTPKNWEKNLLPLFNRVQSLSQQIPNKTVQSKSVQESNQTEVTNLLVIGSSAGGPPALVKLLSGLPSTLNAAVVIIQHLDENFASNLADWLNNHSPLPVRMCQDGDAPCNGVVLLASTNNHLVLNEHGRFSYTPHPENYVYRPSVDVFFRSVNQYWKKKIVAVILTGMGNDGASGLKTLHDSGHYTIAQDQFSCAVYGMPKAAFEAGAVDDVIALDKIANKLIESF